jgi:hypothetical protein
MSGIDYSSAEFWATAPGWAGAVVSAYSSDGDRFYFVDEFGGVSRRQEVGSIDRGEIADMDIPGNAWRLVSERPQAWTGAGLPPVGTACERAWSGEEESYQRVKVLAHDGDLAIFRWVDGPRAGELQDDRQDIIQDIPIFRPIRTPEQIAAEERAQAIEKMWSIYWQPHATSAKQALGLLWDAGLRFADDPDNA